MGDRQVYLLPDSADVFWTGWRLMADQKNSYFMISRARETTIEISQRNQAKYKTLIVINTGVNSLGLLKSINTQGLLTDSLLLSARGL